MEPTEPRLLRTDRLDLRALEVDDLDFLRQLYADPEVARFIGAERLTGEVIGQQVNRFTDVWRERGHGQSVVVERAGGVAIGRVGLHPWAQWDELELGWVLTRTAQGKGFATEAASAWLNWARTTRVAPYLTAVIHPDNEPSIRLAQRLGFVLDRTDRTPWSPAVIYRHDL